MTVLNGVKINVYMPVLLALTLLCRIYPLTLLTFRIAGFFGEVPHSYPINYHLFDPFFV